MEINLQVYVNGEKNVLRLKGASEITGITIVKSFLHAAGLPANILCDSDVDIASSEDILIRDTCIPDLPKPMINHIEGKERFAQEEKGKTSEGDPEYWKTGIKIGDDGHKRYKCRYRCKCGYESNIYISIEEEFVTCYNCGQDLFIEPAGKKDEHGVPNRDKFGNFFLGGDMAI